MPNAQKSIKHVCIYPEVLVSGIGRYAINLCEALIDQGVRVDLFLTQDIGDLKDQKPQGAKVLFGGGSTKKSLKPLFSYLRKEKPDALITAHNHVNVSSILIKKLAFVPTQIMVTLHTAMSKDDHSLKPRVKRVTRELCRFGYPFADHIVAVSDAVAQDTAEHLSLPKNKIDVAYNPVFSPELLNHANDIPEHPFYQQDAPIFISVGRLTEQKDYFSLIKAFAILRKKQEAKLIILGEGEDRAGLEELIVKLELNNDVALPGFVSNPYAYLAASSVFVSSSAWEGLPTVVIEALAFGVPVVATDCPGGSSEILEAGRYGELVAVADVSALANAMQKTLKKTPDVPAMKARASVFSREASAKTYLRLLEEKR